MSLNIPWSSDNCNMKCPRNLAVYEFNGTSEDYKDFPYIRSSLVTDLAERKQDG